MSSVCFDLLLAVLRHVCPLARHCTCQPACQPASLLACLADTSCTCLHACLAPSLIVCWTAWPYDCLAVWRFSCLFGWLLHMIALGEWHGVASPTVHIDTHVYIRLRSLWYGSLTHWFGPMGWSAPLRSVLAGCTAAADQKRVASWLSTARAALNPVMPT